METKHNSSNDATWDNGLSEESIRLLNKESQTHNNLDAKWGEIQSEYRQRYPELMNEDLSYEPDQFDILAKRIAKKTLRTPEEVREEIQNWNPSLYTRYDR